jgi:DNA-binding NtrC family response regulator
LGSKTNRQKSYIAVVDDEKDIVGLFRDALSQIDGCTVFGFTDPQDALKHFIANQQYYNLILTDFRMSELNGIEFIRKVNEIKPSIKALLMSAFEVQDEEIFQQYMKKNIINGFLQKPIALSDLLDEVKNQIGQKNNES